VDENDWLLIQAGAVFAMMIGLALVKHRTRKHGLNKFVKRHSSKKRMLRARAYEAEAHNDDKPDHSGPE